MFSLILTSVISFFSKTSVKWIAIGIIGIIVAFGAWRYTKLVKNNAVLQFNNDQLEINLMAKDKLIKKQNEISKITTEELIKARKEKRLYQKENEDLINNLPEANNGSSPALKELFKRMKKGK